MRYDWHVRLKRAAPDCFAKEVIVVNGEFQPTITVRQGDILQVGVWPSSSCVKRSFRRLAKGTHAHGLSLVNLRGAALPSSGVQTYSRTATACACL